MKGWVECVPNFSEGRDEKVIAQIRLALAASPGIALLDETADADHNRSVFTFAGPGEAVAEALLCAAGIAVAAIDLTKHRGAHPRIGALDVAPFIPLEGASREEVIDLAHRAGQELWSRLSVPVYFYGEAALREDRRRLESVRRGQFEGLQQILPEDANRRPDIGGPTLHPTAGATAVGVRKFLIAFNVDLATADIAVAKEIARRVRESSGGLPCVKALGLALPSRQCAQVSMNLTDFERTSLPEAFEAVRKEAERLGAGVASSEIIGLVPRKALEKTTLAALRIETPKRSFILEDRLAEVSQP
jgi:glutamate formiminotransferase